MFPSCSHVQDNFLNNNGVLDTGNGQYKPSSATNSPSRQRNHTMLSAIVRRIMRLTVYDVHNDGVKSLKTSVK